jgi:hypothetical protein
MASPQDDLFADYTQHLNSFGSGNKAYASPQTTTVPLSSQQGGVLGSCKSLSSGVLGGATCQSYCASLGS